jgi:RimJ/RimL family protein N-acetyltransferase
VGEIRLELLTESHVDAVAALCLDPAVLRFTRVPDPLPPDFAQTWIAAYKRARMEGTREAFAIVDAEGAFLGLALAPEIDRQACEAELGYVTAPAARGRGIASEALRMLGDWAFGELGLLRLVLYISVENAASRRVAERAGYVREGVLRSRYVKPGVREDTELWSRLAADPSDR